MYIDREEVQPLAPQYKSTFNNKKKNNNQQLVAQENVYHYIGAKSSCTLGHLFWLNVSDGFCIV
jgi:hypothetical protein